jgi:hypothetical protein
MRMKNLRSCWPLLIALVCAGVSTAGIQRLPVVSAGSGVILTQDTSVAVVGVEIKPETLNLGSKGVFTAFVTVAGTHGVADVDVGTVVCAGAPAVRSEIAGDTLLLKFNREDLVDVMAGEAVTLTVTGQFTDSQPFMGTDVITVIGPPGPKGKK